jgi:8-amino-7-oxononanoate synthase
MIKNRIKNKLYFQKQNNLYRQPEIINRRQGKCVYINDKKLINFASNDYLGLGCSDVFRQKVAHNFQKFGASSSSSRLVSGNYNTIIEAEKAFATYFGYPACLFYPSGYQANIGLLSALFEKDDTIFFDKHVHASVIKGMLMSQCHFVGYRHNTLSHLEKRLEKYNDHKQIMAVATESLFSMDGDLVNIDYLCQLRDKFDLFCIVDEAHAFGAIGQKGRGIARKVADVAVGTFGKALGLFGAFILGPEWIRDYLINFSSPFIFSTALPEAHGASALDLIGIIDNSDHRRQNLAASSRLMKQMLEKEGFKVRGDAHILALEIGDETKSINISQHLYKHGFLAFPARYPTVPLGRSIIRISMNVLHTSEDIKAFVKALKLEESWIH